MNEFVESMMAEGVEVPRHGLNSSLRICRDSTFGGEQIKHVFAAPLERERLCYSLELIALHLQSVGKRAVFIQYISDLQECWGDINEILRDKKPLYVLIDEAHMMPANDPVWMYLKKPHSPVITIAAAECVATVKKVLSFAHIFTNGHSFSLSQNGRFLCHCRV